MNAKQPPIYVEMWGQTDVGRERPNNEDTFLLVDLTTGAELPSSLVSPAQVGKKGLLLMVADGMGGHEAGEVASYMAVQAVSQRLRAWSGRHRPCRRLFVVALRKAIAHANTLIYQASQQADGYRGMGTTLTAAGVYDGAVFFAQVGDSRGYLLRANTIARMTQDQTLMAELEAAEDVDCVPPGYPLQHVLLQALGPEERVSIPVSFVELRRGDWVLLCSDGLTSVVADEEIRDIVSKTTDASTVCQTLIRIANERGGRDNITVVVARCDGPGLPLPSVRDEPRAQQFVAGAWWRWLLSWRR